MDNQDMNASEHRDLMRSQDDIKALLRTMVESMTTLRTDMKEIVLQSRTDAERRDESLQRDIKDLRDKLDGHVADLHSRVTHVEHTAREAKALATDNKKYIWLVVAGVIMLFIKSVWHLVPGG